MDDEHITTEIAEKILIEAQHKLIIIFGPTNSQILNELIPAADRYEKINAVCVHCRMTASFREKGMCVCRECKIRMTI